jgi:hypothetical protein
MSNNSLVTNIRKSIDAFQAGRIGMDALRSSIETNGQALEGIPYELIKQIDDIEYKLSMSQFADDEECETHVDDVVKIINVWLGKFPHV